MGCRVADWHAQLNNKMGGDLKKIQTVGEYMVEIWRAAGMEGIGTKVQAHSLLTALIFRTLKDSSKADRRHDVFT